jgi:excisionase family DNA binding protein
VHSRIAYSVKEVAEQLGVHQSKIYRMVKSGDLYSIRVMNSIRIPKRTIEELIGEIQTEEKENDRQLNRLEYHI